MVLFLLLLSGPLLADDLYGLYQKALVRDPVVQAARARLKAAREKRPQAIAALLPHLSFLGDFTWNCDEIVSSPIPGVGGTAEFYWTRRMTVQLIQPLWHHDLWVRLSQASDQIAEARYQAELQRLMVRLASAYFDFLFAHDEIEVAEAERQAIAKQLEEARTRLEVGLGTVADVSEAQAAFERVLARLIAARARYKTPRSGCGRS